MTTACSTDNLGADFLQPEGESRPRLLIMMEGHLDNIVKVIPQLLTRLRQKGERRGPKLNAETRGHNPPSGGGRRIEGSAGARVWRQARDR